jgi:hypothetical protein
VEGNTSYRGRSARTANEVWLTAARTVFGWALVNTKVGANPFVGVSISAAGSIETRERELRPGEWRAILAASLAPQPLRMAPHNALARRWVPWLCAYTGSRPAEMTQLRVWAGDLSRAMSFTGGANAMRILSMWAAPRRPTPSAGT